jgi:hypothetical protein
MVRKKSRWTWTKLNNTMKKKLVNTIGPKKLKSWPFLASQYIQVIKGTTTMFSKQFPSHPTTHSVLVCWRINYWKKQCIIDWPNYNSRLASIQKSGLDRKVKHLLPHYIRSMSIVQRTYCQPPNIFDGNA